MSNKRKTGIRKVSNMKKICNTLADGTNFNSEYVIEGYQPKDKLDASNPPTDIKVVVPPNIVVDNTAEEKELLDKIKMMTKIEEKSFQIKDLIDRAMLHKKKSVVIYDDVDKAILDKVSSERKVRWYKRYNFSLKKITVITWFR